MSRVNAYVKDDDDGRAVVVNQGDGISFTIYNGYGWPLRTVRPKRSRLTVVVRNDAHRFIAGGTGMLAHDGTVSWSETEETFELLDEYSPQVDQLLALFFSSSLVPPPECWSIDWEPYFP